MSVVGVLPQGFPPLTLPDVGLSDIGLLFGGALGITLVSLTDTISTASSFAARTGDEIDGQREMIGIGASNIAAGFFQGFPVSTSSYPEAGLLPGCVIFRFDAPLFFANSRTFRDQIRALAGSDPPPSWIIVASEPITDVDTTAADMLQELNEELTGRGTRLVFAEMKDPVRTKVERYELTPTIEPDRFFPTITQAIKASQDETGAEWQPPSA